MRAHGDRYAEEKGEDRLKMRLFYENYCTPQGAQRLARNYPVVCVNYHKIWDNPAALVRALGLPGEEAEKVRDGVSGAGSRKTRA